MAGVVAVVAVVAVIADEPLGSATKGETLIELGVIRLLVARLGRRT
jgi:hypothetical protein